MKVLAHKSTIIPNSFAVDQVRGMFDLKLEKSAEVQFEVELPDLSEDWQIGVIVGPSGSGKSTVAKQAYGEDLIEKMEWDPEKSVVDHFDGLSMKHVTQMLTAVGFSSPPSWIKPYHVLSGGERFRCDLARALVLPRPLIAFDEFTSVVDRTVAKVCSAAIAKSIRKGIIGKKFIAVTCHYDVSDWLEADWVLDMASGELARGRLRRPEIKLTIATIHSGAWDIFKRHHYLNTRLANAAKCFVAFWNDEPVAFSAWIRRITASGRASMREHRTVVLPDFQGVGIGNRVSEYCASVLRSCGFRVYSTTSHPSMIHYRNQSSKWRTCRFGRAAPASKKGFIRKSLSSTRVTASFEYVGKKIPRDLASELFTGFDHVQPIGAIYEKVLNCFKVAEYLSRRVITARLGLPATQVDYALKVLESSGLVTRFKSGKKIVYSAAEKSEKKFSAIGVVPATPIKNSPKKDSKN